MEENQVEKTVSSLQIVVPEKQKEKKNNSDGLSFDTVALTEGESCSSDSSDSSNGSSSIAGASFNFINSIVGAGIVGIPFAIYRCGFFLGVFLLVFVSYLVYFGVHLLVQCGIKVKKNTYEELCFYIFGKKGFYAVSFFMFIFAYGAMLAYIIIIGDTVPKISARMDIEFLEDRSVVIVLFSTIFILPLCLLKDMSSLAWSSLVSVIADIVMIVIILNEAPKTAKRHNISSVTADSPYSFGRHTFFAGLGTMSFAFTCHHSSFFVYSSLRKRTLSTWRIVCRISVLFAFLACSILGLGSYLNLFDKVKGDILNSFDDDDPWINFARALLATTMIFTYPMEQFVARHSLHAMLKSSGEIKNSHHYILTILLWGSSVFIGLFCEDLGIVLELTGAVAASMLGYIIPGALYFGTFHHQFNEVKKIWAVDSPTHEKNLAERIRKSKRFIFPGIMIGFGVLAMIIGTASAFLE